MHVAFIKVKTLVLDFYGNVCAHSTLNTNLHQKNNIWLL